MPDRAANDRNAAEIAMAAQISWIDGTDAAGIFIPGNHDWEKGRRGGLHAVLNQQAWVDSIGASGVSILPRDGCPGPVEISLGPNAILFILNTQWFLHRWEKPMTTACNATSPDQVWALLEKMIDQNPGKRIILAAHHPVISYGEHGGIFQLKQHIFPLTDLNKILYVPLPVVGSIYPLLRRGGISRQDMAHRSYRNLSTHIEKIMQRHPGSLYVSGHEHNLQYIVREQSHFVVSGAGTKTAYARKGEYSKFALSANGFVKAILYDDGRVDIEFWQADGDFPYGKKIYVDSLPAPDG